MNIIPILRTSAVRSLLWPLILLFATVLPAQADDEFWGGGGSYDSGSTGGYGGYGEVVVLPPFPVNGNDPATFDWAGYYASSEFYFMMSDPATSSTPPADSPSEAYENGGGGGTSTPSEASGSPGWDAMSKSALLSATGAVATIRDQCKNDTAIKAALARIIQDTANSYSTKTEKILFFTTTTKTAQESGLAYWVDANGNRVSAINTGTGKPYSNGESGSCDVAVPPKPANGESVVLIHTHAWGGDLSGSSSMGDFKIANDTGSMKVNVVALPMGQDSVQMLTPGATDAYQGAAADIGVTTTKPPGY